MASDASQPDPDVIRCLDSCHDVLCLRHSLSVLLRQGWMDMARARYSMGSSRISHPLFSLKPYSASALLALAAPPDIDTDSPPHMTLVRLDTAYTNSHPLFDSLPSGDERGLSKKVARSKAVPTDWSPDEDAAYRRLMGGEGDSDSDSASAVSNQASEQARPLRWFGALVSPHLQSAQTSFESALELVVKISNAQGEALHAHNRVMQQRDDILEGSLTPEATDPKL